MQHSTSQNKQQSPKIHYVMESNNLHYTPFTQDIVPIYHSWMQDEKILYLTGSEPLSLEEEFLNQKSWLQDPLKYTFIIWRNNTPIGDVNLFFHPYIEENEAEVDIMIADKNHTGKGYAQEAVQSMIAFGHKIYAKTTYIAKIKDNNLPSLHLFKKLGFIEIKKVPAFSEIHLEYKISATQEQLFQISLKEYQL